MSAKQEFYDFLIEYNAFLDQMSEAQKVQLEAVLSRQVNLVEKSIASLQTYLMKLDNMEKRRMELQAVAGFENMTFRQVIEALPNEEKHDFEKAFDEMEKKISDISYYNSKSQDKVKLDLKAMGSAATPEGVKSPAGVYTANKKSASSPHSLFESKA